MQKIKIVTDTASDITVKEAESLDICLLPFKVVLNNNEYRESYDFSTEEFYKILDESENIPSHSQITPFEYTEAIENIANEGYDHIVIVPINQNGSSTFQSAVNARMQFLNENPDTVVKIHIVNTLTYSGGYGYPVKKAAEMAKSNGNIDEIFSFFEDWFSRFELFFTTFDLKYAKESGRVGKASAIAGELLGIKPIIDLSAGNSVTYKKARGIPKALEILVETVKERIGEDKKYLFIYGNNEEEYKELKKTMKKQLHTDMLDATRLGACIAVNAGPLAIGIGFLGEKREMQVIY